MVARGRMESIRGFELVERFAGVGEWRHRHNGLTVLTCPTPVAPVVGFGVVYRVGSRHEVAGHTGATHILEHLIFKGSERFNGASGTEAGLGIGELRLAHRQRVGLVDQPTSGRQPIRSDAGGQRMKRGRNAGRRPAHPRPGVHRQ